MFKNALLVTLVAAILISNCIDMAIAQNYYPTTLGNIWVMESEDKAERLTYTVETSDESINGQALALLKITTETLGTDSIITEKYLIYFDEDGIKLYKLEVELGPVFGVATAVLYPPALFYPFSLAAGVSWEFTANSEVDLVGPVTFTSTNEVVAVENVVTPAGTFENCLKIRIRTKSMTTLGVTRGTAYQWLAPNFGPVKFENTQDIVYELVSSNLLYDVTGDGVVNILDLTFVASHFGQEDAEGDVNNDGTVNILDLVLVAQNFGK